MRYRRCISFTERQSIKLIKLLENPANPSQIYKMIDLWLKYEQFNVNQTQCIVLRLKHPFRVNESISNSRHGQYDITDMLKLI